MEEKKDDIVKIGAEYMHFKGKRCLVENIAYDCETCEKVVIYIEGGKTWVRKLSSFLEEIPERPDNITGQKHRFEDIK
ncbi:MAG: DUF1653 domain-containing protein [Clostridia bacterium]|nr:DUF1653 domain-containing protein [Clostridia bacterium]